MLQPSSADLAAALTAAEASTRLKAALAIGSKPDPDLIGTLVARCAIEPDFFVRDMLTWALARFAPSAVVPLLLKELQSGIAQARSQALHALSKIRDSGTWPAITRSLLRDADDEVARSAWRAAVILVPVMEKQALAEELATQLGRGDQQLQLSLSRALVSLGTDVIEPVVRTALAGSDAAVRSHARAITRLLQDPDAGFELDINSARRAFVLGRQK